MKNFFFFIFTIYVAFFIFNNHEQKKAEELSHNEIKNFKQLYEKHHQRKLYQNNPLSKVPVN